MSRDYRYHSRLDFRAHVKARVEAMLPAIRIEEVGDGDDTFSSKRRIGGAVKGNGSLPRRVVLSPDLVAVNRNTLRQVAVASWLPRIDCDGRAPSGFLNLLEGSDPSIRSWVVTEEPSVARLALLAYENPNVQILHLCLPHLKRELAERDADAADLLSTVEGEGRIQKLGDIRNQVGADY